MVLGEVRDHLGVAAAREPVPVLEKPLAKRSEVVDLAVEHGADRAVLVGDRRIAVCEVDDREPVLGDHAAAIAEAAFGVRDLGGAGRPAGRRPRLRRVRV